MVTNQSNGSAVERKRTADKDRNDKREYRRSAGSGARKNQAVIRSAETKNVPAKRTSKEVKEYSRAQKRENASGKEKAAKKERSKKREKPARVRVLPIWLRIIIVLILAAFALAAGLMIGYGFLGDGTPIDALKVETWRHIIDIVVKE